MTHENLYELLTDAPFRPFTVCTTGGKECVVAHPEFAILSKTQIVVVDPKTERVSIISLTQIASVEAEHEQTV
jgi:hypothetical protein